MALNDLFKSRSLIAVESLKAIVFDFNSRLKQAQSEKEKIIIESQLIDYLHQCLNESIDVRKISPFEKSTAENIIMNKISTKYNILGNTGQINAISTYYLDNVNYMNHLIEQIDGKIRRIEQKRSVLSDWNDNNVRFLLKEKFLSLQNVNFDLSSIKSMSIDVNQGTASLPIKSMTKIPVIKSSIKSGNGFSGNFNSEVTRNNINLQNIFDGDQNSWYEYEKFDSGPLSMTIQFYFEKEKFINEIRLDPFFDESSGGFRVEKVIFLDSNGKRNDLRELLSYEIDEDFFFVNSNSNYWGCKFVPARANSVIIKFSSNSYERVEDLRQRYSIGIRSISFNSIVYESKGFVNSKVQSLIDSLNILLPEVKSFPQKSNLFTSLLSYSLDEGITWEDFDVNDTDTSNETLLNDNKSLLWKLQVERINKNFEIYSSFNKQEDFDYESIQKTFSKDKGKREIKIKEKIIDNDFFVIEKGFINKSNSKNKSLKIANLLNTKFILNNNNIASEEEHFKVMLPINIYNKNLDIDDIDIFVNNKLYSKVESLEDVALEAKSCFFSTDGDFLYVSSDIPTKSSIRWKMKPEEIVPEEKENYFYCPFKSLFDPDKDNIIITVISSELKAKTFNLNLSKDFFKLSNGYIYPSTIRVTKTDGTVLESVDTPQDLDNTKYYFSEENNILRIKDNRTSSGISVYFKYKEKKMLLNDEYEIWYGDKTINGIKINKNIVGAEEIVEDLTADERKSFSQREGMEIDIENLFTNTTRKFYIGKKGIVKNSLKVISNKKLKEVEYIDGESEFFNLIKIENEKTNSMSGVNGIVEFMVAAGKKWYSPTGINFDNENQFKKQASSLSIEGDWDIDENGKIQLVAEKLSEDINYSYYYTNGDKKTESYSIDYENGFLYFSEDLAFSDELKVKYKLLDIISEYSIANKVQNVQYEDNLLKINTDLLYNKVSDIRVFYKKLKTSDHLKDYKKYFSPLIYSIAFRFK